MNTVIATSATSGIGHAVVGALFKHKYRTISIGHFVQSLWGSGTFGAGWIRKEHKMNTVIITGATSGIGLAVVRALLKQKYRVIGIGHSEENCIKAKTQLQKEFPAGDITYYWGRPYASARGQAYRRMLSCAS